MTDALLALSYLQRAFAMARRRPLLPWVLIPALFNLLLFGGLYFMAGSAVADWIEGLNTVEFSGFWSFLNQIIGFLVSAAIVLVWILLFALLASVFTIAVQLVAAPFMGLLAEHVDQQHCAKPLPQESIASMLLRTFKRELRKTWDWVWRSALVLLVVAVVWFIPVINVLASAIWFAWSGWLLGMQYIDYGADTRQVPFSEMKARLHRRRWLVMGFGCLVLALTMLPLVNLLIMPVAVIAGTLIWVETLSGLPLLTESEER